MTKYSVGEIVTSWSGYYLCKIIKKDTDRTLFCRYYNRHLRKLENPAWIQYKDIKKATEKEKQLWMKKVQPILVAEEL